MKDRAIALGGSLAFHALVLALLALGRMDSVELTRSDRMVIRFTPAMVGVQVRREQMPGVQMRDEVDAPPTAESPAGSAPDARRIQMPQPAGTAAVTRPSLAVTPETASFGSSTPAEVGETGRQRPAPMVPGRPERIDPTPTLSSVLSTLATLPTQMPQPDARPGKVSMAPTRRRLVRGVHIPFPSRLAELGEEVEVEARVRIAADGSVIAVDLEKKSGYPEIDLRVEQALRKCVFAKVSGGIIESELVTIRFRLEKNL